MEWTFNMQFNSCFVQQEKTYFQSNERINWLQIHAMTVGFSHIPFQNFHEVLLVTFGKAFQMSRERSFLKIWHFNEPSFVFNDPLHK